MEREWPDGSSVGWPVGSAVDWPDGSPVGWPLGSPVGCPEGLMEGVAVSLPVGSDDGWPDDSQEGWPVGSPLGWPDSLTVSVLALAGQLVLLSAEKKAPRRSSSWLTSWHTSRLTRRLLGGLTSRLLNDMDGAIERADHDDYSDSIACLEYRTLSVASHALLNIVSTVRFVACIYILNILLIFYPCFSFWYMEEVWCDLWRDTWLDVEMYEL